MGDILFAGRECPGSSPLLEARLRDAMEAEQFVLHYQPKVDLASGAICGLEALMRWEDPRRGLVAPDAFIPALEESDLIVEVGQWAIRHALSQRLAWHISGLRPPPIAVNISPCQLRQPEFVSALCEILGTVGVGAPGLTIELSENAILEDGEEHHEKLRAVASRGVSIAIDDCGAACAGLEELTQLAVDELKIDRPHVARMMADRDDLAIVSSIISLAHSRNLTVVAEGVETEAQRGVLRALGCDRMQGYIAAKPLPAPEVARLLASGWGELQ